VDEVGEPGPEEDRSEEDASDADRGERPALIFVAAAIRFVGVHRQDRHGASRSRDQWTEEDTEDARLEGARGRDREGHRLWTMEWERRRRFHVRTSHAIRAFRDFSVARIVAPPNPTAPDLALEAHRTCRFESDEHQRLGRGDRSGLHWRRFFRRRQRRKDGRHLIRVRAIDPKNERANHWEEA
jgi:hypothetical protein